MENTFSSNLFRPRRLSPKNQEEKTDFNRQMSWRGKKKEEYILPLSLSLNSIPEEKGTYMSFPLLPSDQKGLFNISIFWTFFFLPSFLPPRGFATMMLRE